MFPDRLLELKVAKIAILGSKYIYKKPHIITKKAALEFIRKRPITTINNKISLNKFPFIKFGSIIIIINSLTRTYYYIGYQKAKRNSENGSNNRIARRKYNRINKRLFQKRKFKPLEF